MCQLGSTVPNRRNGKFDRAADTPTIEKLASQVGGIVSVKDRLARVMLNQALGEPSPRAAN